MMKLYNDIPLSSEVDDHTNDRGDHHYPLHLGITIQISSVNSY
jgi:hypothetical protein